MVINKKEKLEILAYIRQSVASELMGTPMPTAPDFPFMKEQRATFVSLKFVANNSLRGCIGNIEAFESLEKNLLRNTYNAAFCDPRFHPLALEELNEVVFEVSILNPPVFINSIAEIELGKHGILFELGDSRSVFLPQIPIEENWTKEETMEFLAKKAGLAPEAWELPGVRLEIFDTITFGES